MDNEQSTMNIDKLHQHMEIQKLAITAHKKIGNELIRHSSESYYETSVENVDVVNGTPNTRVNLRKMLQALEQTTQFAASSIVVFFLFFSTVVPYFLAQIKMQL